LEVIAFSQKIKACLLSVGANCKQFRQSELLMRQHVSHRRIEQRRLMTVLKKLVDILAKAGT